MGRPSRRSELLAAGIEVMHRNGYAGSSVDAIVAMAGMQKGAFFSHFGSKDAFVREALLAYFQGWSSAADAILEDEGLSSEGKLEALIRISTGGSKDNFQFGCLIGNMAAEMSNSHDEIRKTLTVLFQQWAIPFERLIRKGQALGDFHSGIDPVATSRFIVNSLQGTILRGKVEHNLQSLEDLIRSLHGLLGLEQPPAGHASATPRLRQRRRS